MFVKKKEIKKNFEKNYQKTCVIFYFNLLLSLLLLLLLYFEYSYISIKLYKNLFPVTHSVPRFDIFYNLIDSVERNASIIPFHSFYSFVVQFLCGSSFSSAILLTFSSWCIGNCFNFFFFILFWTKNVEHREQCLNCPTNGVRGHFWLILLDWQPLDEARAYLNLYIQYNNIMMTFFIFSYFYFDFHSIYYLYMRIL